MNSSIIIGGQRYALGSSLEQPAPVLTWHEHGIQFRAGEGFNKRRTRDIDLVVWHWTGAENEPDAMARNLAKRELGVEFAIARSGMIYQFCDPEVVDTADAAGVNPRSVGVEIVNYGVHSWDRLWMAPALGRDRPVQTVTIHGKAHKVAAFYPRQMRSAEQLAAALSHALGIPAQVPPADDRALQPVELASFTGHVGHHQVSRKKYDPGPVFMRDLRASFEAAA